MPRRRKAAPSAGLQDESLLGLNARIPESLRHRLRLYCVEHDRRMDHLIAEAIREWLDAQGRRRR